MIKLSEGELYCPKCNGSTLIEVAETQHVIDFIEDEIMYGHTFHKLRACPYCKATGKMDWIEFAKGEKPLSEREYLFNKIKKEHDLLIEKRSSENGEEDCTA